MTDIETLNYVKASAVALGLTLDEARAQRVAGHLRRTAAMAQLLDAVTLVPEDEPAEIFRSSPFLSKPDGRHKP